MADGAVVHACVVCMCHLVAMCCASRGLGNGGSCCAWQPPDRCSCPGETRLGGLDVTSMGACCWEANGMLMAAGRLRGGGRMRLAVAGLSGAAAAGAACKRALHALAVSWSWAGQTHPSLRNAPRLAALTVSELAGQRCAVAAVDYASRPGCFVTFFFTAVAAAAGWPLLPLQQRRRLAVAHGPLQTLGRL